MLLSILIPTLESRQDKYLSLVDNILDQVEKGYTNLVEVIPMADKGEKPTGQKRNELIDMAKGEYICFVDDDDELAKNYIDLVMEGIKQNIDCCSLRGVMTWDGLNPQVFEHSIRYNAYATNTNYHPDPNRIIYERYPNHLNVVKKSIAEQVRFREIFQGEDTLWANEIHQRGLIKSEHYIDQVLYHYKFITKK